MEKNLESEFQGASIRLYLVFVYADILFAFACFFLFFESSTNEYWLVVNASV